MPALLIGSAVNTGTGLGTTATSLTFSRPSSALEVGDYVVAIYSQRGSTAEPSTAPSGWTKAGFVSNSNTPGGGSGIWYKRFTSVSEVSADTGSYTASFSARALVVSCVIIRYASGVSSVTNDSSNGVARSTLTYSSITATTSAIAITWLARNAVDSDPLTAWTAPAGFTELLEYNDFDNQEASQGISYKSVSQGVTGSVSYVYSFNSGRISGGLILFYDAVLTALSTRTKYTINQQVQNTTTVQNQARLKPQISQTISNPRQLKPTVTPKAQINQSAQNTTQPRQTTRPTPLVAQTFQNTTQLQNQIAHKPTISQTTKNPTTLPNQSTYRYTISHTTTNLTTPRSTIKLTAQNQTQLSPRQKTLNFSSIQKFRLTQFINNPSTIQISPLQKPLILQALKNSSILNQQLKTTIQSRQSIIIVQDAVQISFRSTTKPQISQNTIVQKPLTQSNTAQIKQNTIVQNLSRFQLSAQINQNVLVNVQNSSRLNQTVQNKNRSQIFVHKRSVVRSTTKILPLVDLFIAANPVNPDINLSLLAIAQINQKTESPQALYLSTHTILHAQTICQGTLIRPKFSVGMPKEFQITRFQVTFTLQDL